MPSWPGDRRTGARPLTSPLARMAGLLTEPVRLPARLLAAPANAVAAPLRRDIARDVRRAIGVPERPAPPTTDPELAFLDPDGVARQVHGDVGSMVIGGLSALLLQSLHPLAMAGVAEHSGYREDPTGRLRRTAAFVGTTTYGTAEQAEQAIAVVTRVHRRVRGVAPDGRPYRADDPDLVTWIHVAEVSSFLRAAQRFGPRGFSPDECDRYYAETSVVPYRLGAAWVPTSAAEVEAYLRRMRPHLYAGRQALDARNFLLRGVARRPEDLAVYAVIASAAVSLLPRWARAELGIPHPPLVDALAVVPAGRALCAGLRWAVSAPPPSA